MSLRICVLKRMFVDVDFKDSLWGDLWGCRASKNVSAHPKAVIRPGSQNAIRADKAATDVIHGPNKHDKVRHSLAVGIGGACRLA
jgi:hypothetical protein